MYDILISPGRVFKTISGLSTRWDWSAWCERTGRQPVRCFRPYHDVPETSMHYTKIKVWFCCARYRSIYSGLFLTLIIMPYPAGRIWSLSFGLGRKGKWVVGFGLSSPSLPVSPVRYSIVVETRTRKGESGRETLPKRVFKGGSKTCAQTHVPLG